ncbi:PAS domain-containing protein [Paraflavisolibacter sp. H34]|uniref:PAS domain-containing protein n=1 Tax=Huijunlia imazamoxiresistens TaxID=3127457 RepID=UPI00301A9F8F
MASDRPNYDALFCGKQPLHQTNLIQPHGVLLVVNPKGYTLIQASENVTSLLGLTAREVVRQPLQRFLTADSFSALLQRAAGGLFRRKAPLSLDFTTPGGPVTYMALVHEKHEALLVEVQFTDRLEGPQNSFIQVFQQVKDVMAAVESARTPQEVCLAAAPAIKRLSGIDKVMIYSFDEEWNGTVLAEVMEEGMESYLGLKFPASDIPKPARDLYLKNPFRIIPDRTYEPVALFPHLNQLTGTLTDLTDCSLRSVAPVHLEYLGNMKVQASLSARIVHNEQLWGLIACHHRTAKFLSFEECSFFELLSNIVSARISSLIHQESAAVKLQLQQHFGRLVEGVYLYDNLTRALLHHQEDLQRLLSAEGVAICWNGTIETVGLTPETDEIRHLVSWLRQKNVARTLHLPSLPKAYEAAAAFADAGSGLLALPIQVEQGNYILAFRPEVIQKVNWGGNPFDALRIEPGAATYHPRHSFQIWKETVMHTAAPWRTEEVAMAEDFRNAIVEYTLKLRNRELQRLIQEFTFVTDFIPEIIWSSWPDGRVDFFNQRWEEYTGLPREMEVGTGWNLVVYPDDVPVARQVWTDALATGNPYETEYRLKDRNGTYRWFLARAIPLRDAEGRIIKWYGSCTDIHDRKVMSSLLEQKVQERTLELQRSNIELEARNHELMQLTHVATHDLQEPARKIHTYSALVKERFLQDCTPEAEGYMERVLRASKRLRLMLNDLLNFSRLYGAASLESTDLNELVGEVLADQEWKIREKSAQVTVEPLPTLEAVPGQMRQVFHNIIANALKFTHPGREPRIHVAAAFVDEPDLQAAAVPQGRYSRISITDNGLGFDQQYVHKMFTMFQRLHTEEEGTGIGLAVVKKIVETHHGLVTAFGKKGEGTQIVMVLPLKQNLSPVPPSAGRPLPT